MIAEAIDTVITLGWALIVWIVLTAMFATLALYAVVVTAWAVGRAVCRTVRALHARARRCAPVSRPDTASRGSRVTGAAPEASGGPSRPAPSWAQTDKEAA